MAQGVEKLAAEKSAAKELIAKKPDVKNLNVKKPDVENRMPTRLSAAIFKGKALLLQLRREAQNRTSGIERFSSVGTDSLEADSTEIVAESRTLLFTEAQHAERALQLGKVQNLRRALRHLNGIVLPAGATFSFWKQVGRATRARGYVAGRQLQEGCLFPAIGGGLCQLSNALYDVALQAGCEILERHPHTRIIPGSAAARGRDAAIAWNYIDLRFRSAFALRLELTLTQNELIVRLATTAKRLGDVREQRSVLSHTNFVSLASLAETQSPASPKITLDTFSNNSQANRTILKAQDHSCVTCGVDACFRQDTANVRTLRQEALRGTPVGRTAHLVDTFMPEFAAYLQDRSFQDRSFPRPSLQNETLQNEALRNAEALLFLPLDGIRWNQPRYAWPTFSYAHVHTAARLTLKRAFTVRAVAADGRARRLAQLDGAEQLAANFARALPWDVSHVVVAQTLLPYLWRDGLLGGRSFDVLMTQLPMTTLQAHLDAAFAAHPDRKLLNDFRADAELVRLESAALQAAQRIITPHAAIAALFPQQAIRLSWQMPSPMQPDTSLSLSGLSLSKLSIPVATDWNAHQVTNKITNRIAFPGPTHARKGAYELRAVARAMNLEVVLTGSELEGENFWQGLTTRRISADDASKPNYKSRLSQRDWLDGVSIVVQPAVVEAKPRLLLEALARGIPVIATSACGLGDMPGVTTVPVGDEEAICGAIAYLLFQTAVTDPYDI